MNARDTAPILALFTGCLLTATLVRSDERERSGPDWSERMPDSFRRDSPADADHASARELCALPGIGPTRALAIVRERFEHGMTGGPRTWDRVPGIGPETVRRMRAWFDARAPGRVVPDHALLEAPARGAYTSEGNAP